MSKLIPTVYFLSVFAVFILAWYVSPEDRLVSVTWALPGLLIGTFATVWDTMAKLERRIVKLEREREALKGGQAQ